MIVGALALLMFLQTIAAGMPSRSNSGDELLLKGAVDEQMYERIRDFPGRIIRIESPGGSVLWGTRIAEVLADRDIEVHVEGQCISACFSYIFVPAKRRVLGSGAVLGAHVGPITLLQIAEAQGLTLPEWDRELSYRMREVLRKRRIPEALFGELGRRLNVSLVNRPLGCLSNDAPGAPWRTVPCQWIKQDVRTWYLETSQLNAFGIGFEGREIRYRNIEDTPLGVLFFRSNEAAYFGDCLYMPSAQPPWNCLGTGQTRP